MTKRMFYRLFKPAFEKAFFVEKAFSVENIESAWQKTGLWPYDPPVVLDIFKERPNTNILVNINI